VTHLRVLWHSDLSLTHNAGITDILAQPGTS